MSNDEIIQTRNKPSAIGRQLGAQLARLTDREEQEMRGKFPNHAERCKSCAFRGGTFPNGCEVTLMDAIKCVVETTPFMCHEHFDKEGKCTEICAGFMIAMSAFKDGVPEKLKNMVAPWEFSK